MRPSIRTRALRRLPLVLALSAAVLALGGFQSGPSVASADDTLATVKSCDTNSSSSISVDCTIVLNSNVDAGGSWKLTITDSSATVTACDGSASGATCSVSSNTAEFDCSSACQVNSTYKITVAATSATATQESFVVLSPGTVTVASNTVGVPTITVGLGGATGSGAVMAPSAATVAYSGPQQIVASGPPPGGACVGGSVPGPNGCTSTGPLLPTVGAGYGGAYGGCYGAYACGGTYGYGSAYGGCLGLAYCGGTGLGGCTFAAIAGFGNACNTNTACATATLCAVAVRTNPTFCSILYGGLAC